jgi:hypothetical protein
MTPPNLVLMNMFGAPENDESSTIKWESQIGTRGMAPFIAPGDESPQTSPIGFAKHSAEAAFWSEKMRFDEEFLNNLRQVGTESTYQPAAQTLAKNLAMLKTRIERRKEWMFAKMITAGSFSYLQEKGRKIAVDYSLPSAQQVTLGANYKWNTGTKRDIMNDIMNAMITVRNSCGAKIDTAMTSSNVLKSMAQDPTIQTLLTPFAYGKGNLFSDAGGSWIGVNPAPIAQLLAIPNFIIYDEMYVVRAWLTGAVTADSTTAIPVDDTADFEVGGTLRFNDQSAGTWEEETISAVNTEAGTVTVSTAPSTSYKASEDYVTMTRRYVADNLFTMWASMVDGQKIASYRQAPFSLNRHYGTKVDQWEDKDPDAVWIRAQNKGLPVLFQRDAIYILTVQ